MNKKCKACGADVPNDAKFCQVCGGTDFVADAPAQQQLNDDKTVAAQPVYNQNSYNPQSPVGQAWQPPAPQSKPRKKKTGLIIGIVAAVVAVAVIATIGVVSEKKLKDKGYGYYDSDIGASSGSSNGSSVGYTKGTFDGSVYVNDWADIKLEVPEGFSNADSSIYSTVESSTVECGVYLVSDDGMNLIYICCEKLPTYPVYSESEYLDASVKNLDSVNGISASLLDEHSKATVAGRSYTKAEVGFNNGYVDLVDTMCVRKIDGYMVFVCAVGQSAESNMELIDSITKAK